MNLTKSIYHQNAAGLALALELKLKKSYMTHVASIAKYHQWYANVCN